MFLCLAWPHTLYTWITIRGDFLQCSVSYTYLFVEKLLFFNKNYHQCEGFSLKNWLVRRRSIRVVCFCKAILFLLNDLQTRRPWFLRKWNKYKRDHDMFYFLLTRRPWKIGTSENKIVTKLWYDLSPVFATSLTTQSPCSERFIHRMLLWYYFPLS